MEIKLLKGHQKRPAWLYILLVGLLIPTDEQFVLSRPTEKGLLLQRSRGFIACLFHNYLFDSFILFTLMSHLCIKNYFVMYPFSGWFALNEQFVLLLCYGWRHNIIFCILKSSGLQQSPNHSIKVISLIPFDLIFSQLSASSFAN